MATQHADLTDEAWSRYTPDRRILTIAAEMYRAGKRLAIGDLAEVKRGYERVLNLADLTRSVAASRGLRREMARWRELVGALYVSELPSRADHDALLGVLLTFSPEAFLQRPYLLSGA